MTVLLSLSVAIFAGLMLTRLLNRWRLPDVTAYLIAGVLIGPCLLGRLGIAGVGFDSYAQIEDLGLISDVALGFIAFSIGHEFRVTQLKATGRQAVIIGVLQAVVTTACVDVALFLFHALRPDVLSLPAAITLGAIAAATAVAAARCASSDWARRNAFGIERNSLSNVEVLLAEGHAELEDVAPLAVCGEVGEHLGRVFARVDLTTRLAGERVEVFRLLFRRLELDHHAGHSVDERAHGMS